MCLINLWRQIRMRLKRQGLAGRQAGRHGGILRQLGSQRGRESGRESWRETALGLAQILSGYLPELPHTSSEGVDAAHSQIAISLSPLSRRTKWLGLKQEYILRYFLLLCVSVQKSFFESLWDKKEPLALSLGSLRMPQFLSVYLYGTAKDRGVFRLEIGREQETNDKAS